MIFPNVSLEEWTKKTGLQPSEVKCTCGRKSVTTIPIISKDFVGLGSPECKCGHEMPGFKARARDQKIQSEMKALFGV